CPCNYCPSDSSADPAGFFFFSSRRRHTRFSRDWSSDVCSSDLDRGLEGKIAAVRYARENHIPYLGDCLGLQMLVVEFARHVAMKIGRASCRERVYIIVVVLS